MKNIPNLFTLLNLFFGCIAVILILQNGIAILSGPDGEQFISMPEKVGVASLFIGLAALVDFLDGLVARIFNATSPMGKQLDSLADLVSFGVAPGMILYQLLRMSFAGQENTNSPAVVAALTNKWVLYGLTVLVAWLMISKLPLMALKFKDYSVKGNLPKLVLLVLALLSVIFLRWLAVPVIFILYIIVSLLTAKKNA